MTTRTAWAFPLVRPLSFVLFLWYRQEASEQLSTVTLMNCIWILRIPPLLVLLYMVQKLLRKSKRLYWSCSFHLIVTRFKITFFIHCEVYIICTFIGGASQNLNSFNWKVFLFLTIQITRIQWKWYFDEFKDLCSTVLKCYHKKLLFRIIALFCHSGCKILYSCNYNTTHSH